MPIIESAKKRVRSSKKKEKVNRKWKDRVKDAIKDYKELIEENKAEEAKEQLKETKSVIDKAVKNNILHENNAARKKSRLSKMLNEIK
ncbi:MAG TPA: 30S ribosomal protein S20 [Halanaerobiales bacterium]|nr:30S ribosomal protein S20 [Halanaerobiales bacterium]